jgi:hypothetical protein
MPIPDFDHNYVLPPHLGDPINRNHLSPYPCTSIELCQKFSHSATRVRILKNFLSFREQLTNHRVIFGFQWLDGSFLTDIETIERRPPRDLDVVTFFGGISIADQQTILTSFPEFGSSQLAKANYLLDHYAVDYAFRPEVTVEQTRYWIQLFTHSRLGVWKGMLRIPLNTPNDDRTALV